MRLATLELQDCALSSCSEEEKTNAEVSACLENEGPCSVQPNCLYVGFVSSAE